MAANQLTAEYESNDGQFGKIWNHILRERSEYFDESCKELELVHQSEIELINGRRYHRTSTEKKKFAWEIDGRRELVGHRAGSNRAGDSAYNGLCANHKETQRRYLRTSEWMQSGNYGKWPPVLIVFMRFHNVSRLLTMRSYTMITSTSNFFFIYLG